MPAYIQRHTQLPRFLPFPRFLLEMQLSPTAKILYTLLLDRAKLSCTHDGWEDSNGNVYVNYTIQHLAQTIGKRESCIKESLKALSDAGLIVRKHQGIGRPNRIYVLLPDDSNPPKQQPEKQPRDSRKSVGNAGGKPSGNKPNELPDASKLIEGLGTYGNVFLSDADLEELKRELPDWGNYVERLSCYLASTGKNYRNHAATIRMWATKEKKTVRVYERGNAL